MDEYFYVPLLRWKSQENMETSHHGLLTGCTAVILKKIPAMIYDGLRCSQTLKIAGKWPISSHRVAGPIDIEYILEKQYYSHTA